MTTVTYGFDFNPPKVEFLPLFSLTTPKITAVSGGSGYVMVWEQNNDILLKAATWSDSTVFKSAATLNSTLSGVQTQPAIATLANGNTAVVFSDGSANAAAPVIRVILTSPVGTALGSDLVIGTGDGVDGNAKPAIAASGERFATVWVDRDGDNAGNDLYLSVYGQTLTPVTVNRALTTSINTEDNPDIAALRDLGRFVVVWDEKPFFSSNTSIFASVISNDGATTVVPRLEIGSPDWATAGDPSVIGLSNGGFAVAYTGRAVAGENREIIVSTYNASGERQTTTRVTNSADNDEVEPDLLEMPDGRLVAAYTANSFPSTGSRYSLVTPATGDVDAALFRQGASPSLAFLSPNAFIAASFDQQYAVINGAGTPALVTYTGAPQREVRGTDAANILVQYSGQDVFFGEGGVDTMIFPGARTDYSFQIFGSEARVRSLPPNFITVDTLRSVERGRFSDGVVAFDINLPDSNNFPSNAGSAYRLYEAAFNRAPDNPGLAFWIKAIDGGVTAVQAAQGFVNSSEFQGIYGANPGATQLVTQFYQNILDRAPEKAGLDFWVGILEGKPENRALVLEGIANSAENQAALFPVIGQGIFVPGNLLF